MVLPIHPALTGALPLLLCDWPDRLPKSWRGSSRSRACSLGPETITRSTSPSDLALRRPGACFAWDWCTTTRPRRSRESWMPSVPAPGLAEPCGAAWISARPTIQTFRRAFCLLFKIPHRWIDCRVDNDRSRKEAKHAEGDSAHGED